jgi:hypothetical protein
MTRHAKPRQSGNCTETDPGPSGLSTHATPSVGRVANPHLVRLAQSLGQCMAREAFAAAQTAAAAAQTTGNSND